MFAHVYAYIEVRGCLGLGMYVCSSEVMRGPSETLIHRLLGLASFRLLRTEKLDGKISPTEREVGENCGDREQICRWRFHCLNQICRSALLKPSLGHLTVQELADISSVRGLPPFLSLSLSLALSWLINIKMLQPTKLPFPTSFLRPGWAEPRGTLQWPF